mgnify:CR=1 FL=1
MDKTHNISLGGFSFIIENGAASQLSAYLTKVRQYLGQSADTDEILTDVEQRMAELLKARMQNTEVVTSSDIDYLIQVMGKPEQYVQDDEELTFEKSAPVLPLRSRKLYRDISKGSIGGVLSGLSYYFHIDVTLLRIIYMLPILLNIGILSFTFNGSAMSLSTFSILLYVVLWLVIPPAKTTAEKLEMKGLEVNIDTISSHKDEVPQKRQWLRSTSDKWLMGVLGGLAKYFSISSIWLRIGVICCMIAALISTHGRALLFVLLYGFLAYGLKKDNESDSEQDKQQDSIMPLVDNTAPQRHSRSILGQFFHIMFKGASYFLVMIFIFIVFILLMVVLSALLGIGIFSGASLVLLHDYLDFVLTESWQQVLFYLSTTLLIVLFISIFTLLVMKVFSAKGYQTPRWWFATNILITLVSFLGVFALVTSASRSFISYNAVEEKHPIALTSDTLFVYEKPIFTNGFLVDSKGVGRSGDVHFLGLGTTQQQTPYLLIKTTSQGKNTDEAMENAKKIEYPIEMVGDSLTLPDGYLLNKGNPYRMQRVYLKLFLPQGKMAKFTKFPTMKRGNLFPRGIYKAINDSIVEVKK